AVRGTSVAVIRLRRRFVRLSRFDWLAIFVWGDEEALIQQPLWPLAVYGAAVCGIVATMIGLSYVLGQRHHQRATDEPYESGMPITGTARLRFSAKFYLVAMFFVIFDLEAVYLFGWAIAARDVGWTGYVEALVFTLILMAGL